MTSTTERVWLFYQKFNPERCNRTQIAKLVQSHAADPDRLLTMLCRKYVAYPIAKRRVARWTQARWRERASVYESGWILV